jgi:hypothetical protein
VYQVRVRRKNMHSSSQNNGGIQCFGLWEIHKVPVHCSRVQCSSTTSPFSSFSRIVTLSSITVPGHQVVYQSDIYYIFLASTVPVPDSCLMGCKRRSKTCNLARTTEETEWRNRMQSMELAGITSTGDRNIMKPLLDLIL